MSTTAFSWAKSFRIFLNCSKEQVQRSQNGFVLLLADLAEQSTLHPTLWRRANISEEDMESKLEDPEDEKVVTPQMGQLECDVSKEGKDWHLSITIKGVTPFSNFKGVII